MYEEITRLQYISIRLISMKVWNSNKLNVFEQWALQIQTSDTIDMRTSGSCLKLALTTSKYQGMSQFQNIRKLLPKHLKVTQISKYGFLSIIIKRFLESFKKYETPYTLRNKMHFCFAKGWNSCLPFWAFKRYELWWSVMIYGFRICIQLKFKGFIKIHGICISGKGAFQQIWDRARI